MRKYSIVIPTYNRKKLLKNTLEALNSQKGNMWDDFEVIVVDDGSDDGTWEYIKNLNTKYEIRYFYLERCERSSRSRTRNFGWKVADGEIVVFIDSDIIVQHKHLKELDRCFDQDSDIVVVGNRIKLPRGALIDFGNLYDFYGFNKFKTKLLDITYYMHEQLSYNMSSIRGHGYLLSSCNAAIPKKYLEEVDGFDENFKGWGHEDCELGLRLQSLKALRYVINYKMDVFHQYHEINCSNGLEGEENMKYLAQKYPFTPDNMSVEELFKIWHVFTQSKNSYLAKYSVGWEGNLKTIQLDFREISNLEVFKESIIRLSDQKGLNIVIRDYVENSDLDIWVQLLGVRNSTPKYFPVSRTNLVRFAPYVS